ncbi:FMN-binding protein [Paenarthrobacter sp. DKR-5]|uniref:FMN-binding protein n=1 Tax=Paenarthrobacter sp. DKR-5 TaxID=2835535 RepID=UPI0020287C6C|nr:FMN-binding protein [Paenarthrobacter sp. DKR-5]
MAGQAASSNGGGEKPGTGPATGSSSSGSGAASGSGSASTGSSAGSGSTGSGNASSGSSGSGSSSSSGSTAKSGTFTGQSVSTPYGNVQVQVTIASGKIAEVTPLQLTDADGRSQMISSQAAPMLRSEVLQAQSANVQSIGGATYTSEGYLTSLQSALDAASYKG